VEWKLVRASENPSSERYISAYGRDVEIAEGRVDYDATTKRLVMVAGSRLDARTRAALVDVLALLGGASEPQSVRAIEVRCRGRHPQNAIRAAIKLGVTEGRITAEDGPKRAILHRLKTPDVQRVERVETVSTQSVPDERVSVSAPRGRGTARVNRPKGKAHRADPSTSEPERAPQERRGRGRKLRAPLARSEPAPTAPQLRGGSGGLVGSETTMMGRSAC
jgi:hypothetical protein